MIYGYFFKNSLDKSRDCVLYKFHRVKPLKKSEYLLFYPFTESCRWWKAAADVEGNGLLRANRMIKYVSRRDHSVTKSAYVCMQ